MRRAVALLVAVPAGAGLLPVAAHFDQPVGDRQLAIVWICRRPPLAAAADIQPREIADRERPHRIAEIDHHLVDLLRQAAFLQQNDHLGVERRARAVGDEAVGIARHGRRSCRSSDPAPSPTSVSAARLCRRTTSSNFITLAGLKKCVPATSCGRFVIARSRRYPAPRCWRTAARPASSPHRASRRPAS